MLLGPHVLFTDSLVLLFVYSQGTDEQEAWSNVMGALPVVGWMLHIGFRR